MSPESHRSAGVLAVATLLISLVGSACGPGTAEDPRNEDKAGLGDKLYPVLEEGLWGYMNRDGHLAVAPQFDAAWPFSEGRALVQLDGRFGYLDRNGDVVVPLQYHDAWYFSNGLAPVLIDSAWSFIDYDGAVVVNSTFGIGAPATPAPAVESVELDRVRVGDHYGFRNADGRIVIDPLFDQAWHFVDGLARVQVDGKWGFIGRTGEMVVDPLFDVAWDFEDGLARVKVDDRFGYINTRGDYIWAPTR